MNGPQELLFAYYRRLDLENRHLRERNEALVHDNKWLRKSRDDWKAKALSRRMEAKVAKRSREHFRARAEHWKCRALREQEAREIGTLR